jgi:hypothetical protein
MTGERNNAEQDGATEAGFRPFTALAFWCSLFIAAGLFALLALAPKLRTYRELAHEYDSLHRQLVCTERRTECLAKVADALEHDPDFAAELARINFDAPGGDERIPVGPQLRLAAWDSEPTLVANHPASLAGLLDGPLLNTFSDDRTVRVSLMAAAALLVLVSFAFCGERTANRDDKDSRQPRVDIRGWLADRYRKSAAD